MGPVCEICSKDVVGNLQAGTNPAYFSWVTVRMTENTLETISHVVHGDCFMTAVMKLLNRSMAAELHEVIDMLGRSDADPGS